MALTRRPPSGGDWLLTLLTGPQSCIPRPEHRPDIDGLTCVGAVDEGSRAISDRLAPYFARTNLRSHSSTTAVAA